VCQVIDIVIERKPAKKARWSKPKIAEIVGPSDGAAIAATAPRLLRRFTQHKPGFSSRGQHCKEMLP